jgi:hypothetical protein
MPFALVLAWAVATERSRGGLALLGLFLLIGAFAYPLAVPIPLIPMLVVLWPERHRVSPRRLYHGRRSLWWMIPLLLILIVPVAGVFEKAQTAVRVVFDPSFPLDAWGGDLFGFYPERWFLGAETITWMAVLAPFLLYGVWRGLRSCPPALARGLAAVMVFAVVFAAYFRLRPVGWYFHFKVLAFVAPLMLTVAVAGLGRIRRPLVAVAVIGLVLISARESAVGELSQTFDQLPKYVLALRTIDAGLPPGRSVRLDVAPEQQNWIAYMLHGQPLCSEHPLLGTSYPHVPTSRKADYILVANERPRPTDAEGAPLRRLTGFVFYREKPGVPGPANCSQRMVQTVHNVTAGT